VLGLTSTTLDAQGSTGWKSASAASYFLRDQSGLTLSDEGAAMIGDVMEMERHAFNVFSSCGSIIKRKPPARYASP